MFLMVYNTKRDGWEMPGGKIEPGESPEQAAKREYEEESGHSIEILDMMDLDKCIVCVGKVLGTTTESCEMESRFFSDLPDKLAFGREEYDDVLLWAKSKLYNDI
ncbi:MAG: NUDIX domain-containing protein [Candidatus Methanoplasma sp.]|jgi:8-oxo-dGTP diphosphatase|nr:NUDIX domain-containing protein [Candidatus Methanoplasma sp.]